MIINIVGRQTGDKLDTKLEIVVPPVRFDSRLTYKVSIRHLHFILANNDVNRHLHDNELLCLTTNLVDLSSINTMQSPLFFAFNAKRHLWQNIKFPDSTCYNLALHEIDNASFGIVKVYNEQQLILDNIFIQLEIQREITHGWVQ